MRMKKLSGESTASASLAAAVGTGSEENLTSARTICERLLVSFSVRPSGSANPIPANWRT